jgi:hypothetical protein
MINLNAIFGSGPALVAAVAPEPVAVPEADPRPEAADDGQAVPMPPGEPALGADSFAGWVPRQDCHGRMGWEAPDLPDWQCWWARADFDDLPELADVLV